jgi:hypothetical protein
VKSTTKEEIEFKEKSFNKKSLGSEQKNSRSTDNFYKSLKQSTLKVNQLGNPEDATPPQSENKEGVASPNSNSMTLTDAPDMLAHNNHLRRELTAAHSQINQLKIENEKNSQLFQMFDQKMKDIQ